MDVDTITALTPICKYVLVFLGLAIVFWVLRDPLKGLVDRLIAVKVKTKGVEAELSAPLIGEAQGAPAIRYEEQVALEEAPRPEEELEPSDIEPASAAEWATKMLAAFRVSDLEAAQAAFNETQEVEDDPVKKLQYKALYTACRYEHGDTSALGELQQLAEQDGVAMIAYPLLAQCYQDAGDFKHAAKSYDLAAQHADSEQKRADAVVQAAICLFEGGKQEDAYTRVMQEISELTAADAVCKLYEGLASLYDLDKELELRAFALEKALEIKPNDMKLRFRAAHSYGEKNLDPLSLLHYKTLIRLNPDEAGSLNNIGVAYSRLQMPIRAIQSYKAAARLNYALAAGNLALSFVEAGFVQEARQSIEEAKKQEKTDPQVGRAMIAISEMEGEEAREEDVYLNAARDQQRFFLSFAEAYFTRGIAAASFAGSWKFADGAEATISQTDNEIEANWNRDHAKYKLTGQVNNRGASITTYKMRYSLGKELDFGDDGHGYAYLSPDGQQLFVMTLKVQEHSLETLTRSED
ncbi:MAG TPA: hypothetical protein VM537_20725, partial [Anaerolineae bacterium]|nr:hypothetical protein [Anaerolineae bacterium]